MSNVGKWLCKCINNTLCFSVLLLMATSCSDSDNIDNVLSRSDRFNFKVSVTNKKGFGYESRGLEKKSNWLKGDTIIFSVDGNDKNLGFLIYDGDSIWHVNPFKDMNFSKDAGHITALYATHFKVFSMNDTISPYSVLTYIKTNGDILYSEDGNYEKAGNIIKINLNMDKRPIAKIQINGIGKGFSMKGDSLLKTIRSFNPISWEASTDRLIERTDESGDTAVFYGMVSSRKDSTVISLVDINSGNTFERNYNRLMTKGAAIYINGPLSQDSALWQHFTRVLRLSLNNNIVKLLPQEEFDLKAYIFPQNATNQNIEWKSDNEDVATVSQTGHIKAMSIGTANITAYADNKKVQANCNIVVSDISSFISLRYTGSSIFSINGIGTVSLGINIANSYSKAVVLNTISLYNTSGQIVSQSSFSNAELSAYGTNSYTVTLRNVNTSDSYRMVLGFTYNGKTYNVESYTY